MSFTHVVILVLVILLALRWMQTSVKKQMRAKFDPAIMHPAAL